MGNQNEIYRRSRHEPSNHSSKLSKPSSKGQQGKDHVANDPSAALDRVLSGPVTALAPDDILSLQRNTSNRAVQQLIARRKQDGYSNEHLAYANHNSTAVLQRDPTKKQDLIKKGILVPTLQFPKNQPETPKLEPVTKPPNKSENQKPTKPEEKPKPKPEDKPKPKDKVPERPKGPPPPIPKNIPGMAIVISETHLHKKNLLGFLSKTGAPIKEGEMVELVREDPTKKREGWHLAKHPKSGQEGYLKLSKTITHVVSTPSSAFAEIEKLHARGGFKQHEGGLNVGNEALEATEESSKTLGSITDSAEEGADTVKKLVSPKEWMKEDEWNIVKDTEPFKSMDQKPDFTKDMIGVAGGVIGSFSGIISIVAGFTKAFKDGKITWDNAEKTVVRIMEGLFKTVTGGAKLVLTAVKWVGHTATEIAGQCLDAVKSGLDGIVGIFKTVINAKKGKKWEAFKEGIGSLMNFGKGAISAVQFGISVAKNAAASIPFVGPLIQILGGVLNIFTAAFDIGFKADDIKKSEKDVGNKEKEMLHVKDKKLFAQKLVSAGLGNQVKGMDKASDVADVVRGANPDKLKSDKARKDLQELKEWALDLQLIEIGNKRQKKGIYTVLGKGADIVSGILSIIGGIGGFIAEVIGPATAGIGFAVGKAISFAGGILSTAVKIGQVIAGAVHGAGLKIRQWGRDIAAKTGVGTSIFNVKKSTTEKKKRRVQDAITLFKSTTSIPIPAPKRHSVEEMKALKTRWEGANMRMKMTGVDMDKLKELDGKPNEQIATVAEAMAERGD